MSEDALKVPEELFKDVKFYVVGDIDQKVHLTAIGYSFSLLANSGYWLVLAWRLTYSISHNMVKLGDTCGHIVLNIILEYNRLYLIMSFPFVCVVTLSAVGESPVFSMLTLAVISDNNATPLALDSSFELC